jgi:DNA polymerase I-like protein with 3'-5' exonuclease and polymerase domains
MPLIDDVFSKKRHTLIKELPPIPETGWRPPSEFPNLAQAKSIGIDTETYDPQLMTYGPGWGRGRGNIVGVSLSAVDSSNNLGKWYFPIRHTLEPEYNLNPANVIAYLKDTLANPNQPKIGANLMYDVGWLGEEDISVHGKLYDVQFAAALLADNDSVSLDYLSHKYIGSGKTTYQLYEWLERAYGKPPIGDQRANIYRASPRLVGPYAEDDAVNPLIIINHQWKELQRDGLLDLFEMECNLIPLLIGMRKAGVTVDTGLASEMYDTLGAMNVQLYKDLQNKYGVAIESVGSPDQLARVFDAAGVPYIRKGERNKPSFTKPWLEGLEHDLGDEINQIREYEKLRSTFIRGYLLDSSVPILGTNGLAKIHCSFHPLKGDDGGTITGRFSSSDPNLQNIPVRSKAGKLIRTAFVPDIGHQRWRKRDYSQIEYRMLAHFATDGGDGSADGLRQAYIANPNTDYHDVVYYNVCPFMGWDPTDKALRTDKRRPIKNINFGLLYGQSAKSLAFKAGFTSEQAKEFFDSYHKGAPYVKPTMANIAGEVQARGFVTTILGRRTRFTYWEPRYNPMKLSALPYHMAIATWGSNIKLAGEYKGVNYKLQGSAADVIKVSMVKAYNDGVFDVTGLPKLQVHDELDFSVIDDSPRQKEAYRHLDYILENTVPCRIPIKVDGKDGDNWGVID